MPRRVSTLMRTAVILACTASALAACNTTKGAGEDLSSAGQAISTSATQNKGY